MREEFDIKNNVNCAHIQQLSHDLFGRMRTKIKTKRVLILFPIRFIKNLQDFCCRRPKYAQLLERY